MVHSKREQKIFQLILFRKNMGITMPREKLCYFWGGDFENIDSVENDKEKKCVREKIDIVKRNIRFMLFLDWVQFIGITGSVAAGTAENRDDIDVFIVVKNNRMWLYRAILTLRLGTKSLRRVWGKSVKDKIDTNFICEERGLLFNTESIFILHELLFMIPVYNEEYYEKVLNINHRLLKNYCIERDRESVNEEKKHFFSFLNKLAFITQYVYMLVKNHKPDYKRLKRNNRKGRIAFFPENFRKEKVEEYEKLLKNSKRV